MTPTFETVFEQAKELPLAERIKLITALSKGEIISKSGEGKRLEKIRAFRGKYRDILPSTKEFLVGKREEVEFEER